MFFDSAGSDFCATDNFPRTFLDYRFMMFTQVLMKELAHILIHVQKIFIFRVFFKVLLSMYLRTAEKEL